MVSDLAGDDKHIAERFDALQAALTTLGFGMMLVTPDGKIVDADERAAAITGRTRDELLALEDVTICVAPEQRHRITERRSLRRDGPVPAAVIASVLARPDGSRVPVEWAAAEIGRETGHLLVAAVLRDATQQVNTERLVTRYERLIENSPVAIITWDATGVDDPLDMRLLSANAAAVVVLPQLNGERISARLGDLFANSLDDARRTLALRGTGAMEFFADFVIGDPNRPTGVYRRRAIDLGDNVLAFELENVTGERVESLRRRRLLERLVDTGDDERRAIALAVHDEPIQQLAAATLLVEALRRSPATDQRDLRLAAVEQSLRATMAGLRRLVFELSPPELVESGLRGALDSAAAYLFDGTDTIVTLDVAVPDEPDPAVQTAAYRIAAEALSNIRKHAVASHVLVDLNVQDEVLHIDVSDNGGGFKPPIGPGRVGLRAMRERANALGGECNIDSGPDGTRVHAVLPLSGRTGNSDGAFESNLAATGPALSLDAVETLRREHESLAARNDRQHATIVTMQQRLEHTFALWATLDDPTLDAPELLRRTVRHVAELCPDGCGVRFVSANGSSWEHVVDWHPDPEQLAFLDRLLVHNAPNEASHAHTVLRGNAAVLLDRRVSSWAVGGVGPIPPAPVEPNSAILTPIRVRGVAVGVLTVIRDLTSVRLAEADVDLQQAIADRLGAALERAAR